MLARTRINTILQTGSEKIDFNIDVMITTLHSSKGLEFDYVIVPEFNEDKRVSSENEDEEYWNNQRKLWYVAFSRARNKLDVMYYDNKNVLLEEIDRELYRKIEL
ncbi:3'-5' exonuclease [Clostridium massiliamazoniense]|uniref:3'-5' exonuclease n=1 Tax=Clostridium massiliamazoniense TaxID=1347366 RepID=UPI0006D76E96|nr:3'-5' exonuclease [Clostridium massiliamazoniense]